MDYEFKPYRVVYRQKTTGRIVFEDVIQAAEHTDPEQGQVLVHEHLQILEDLHGLFGDNLTVDWHRYYPATEDA